MGKMQDYKFGHVVVEVQQETSIPLVVATATSARTATFNDGTNDNVSFDRVRCAGKFYSDIYKVSAADTA